jgi:RimK-like ATP-grasp domain
MSFVHEAALVSGGANRTTVRLAESWCRLGLRARLVTGRELSALEVGDVAVGRLAVLPELDGVEQGSLRAVPARAPGRRRQEHRSGSDRRPTTAAHHPAAGGCRHPQPHTEWVRSPGDRIEVGAPLVVKPRFGSWGKDVHRCDTEREARGLLRRLAGRSWFRRRGALVQELVPPRGRDLGVLVAGGCVIGAAERTPAAVEWRTDVSLGGHKGMPTPGRRRRRSPSLRLVRSDATWSPSTCCSSPGAVSSCSS